MTLVPIMNSLNETSFSALSIQFLYRNVAASKTLQAYITYVRLIKEKNCYTEKIFTLSIKQKPTKKLFDESNLSHSFT